MANIVEKYKISTWSPTDKIIRVLEKTEKAVTQNKIDACLKEDFKKVVTHLVSEINITNKEGPYFFESYHRFVREIYPNLLSKLFSGKLDDAEKILDILQNVDYKKVGHISSTGLENFKKSIERQMQIFEFRAELSDLRKKVNALTVEGEVVKKEKKDIAVDLPVSKYFKNFDFLKWYTPKFQQMIVDAVPAIEKALDEGITGGRNIISWKALFGKSKLEYYDILDASVPSYAKKIEPNQVKAVNKDFSALRDVLTKVVALETKSQKEREKAEHIKRVWTPAADLLKSQLQKIIKGTIDQLKKHLEQNRIASKKANWDKLKKAGVKNKKDFYKYVEENKLKYFSFQDVEEFFKDTKYSDPKRQARVEKEMQKFNLNYSNSIMLTEYPASIVSKAAKAMAESQGNDIAKHFVDKNLDKLVSLLHTKEVSDIAVLDLYVSGGAIHSEMLFTFKDKSSFKVKNKIVYGYSSRNTHFARYPTTFHEVIVKGKPMSQPSEYKVYIEFSGEKPPKKEEEE
jgi:hypothetical protein